MTRENVEDTIDLLILNADSANSGIVFARSGTDMALARLPFDKLEELDEFRLVIEKTMKGEGRTRPSAKQLIDFGQELFRFIIRDSVEKLYTRLPKTYMRVHILSDSPKLRALPWEFIQEPERNPGPWPERSVVRIVFTDGVEPLSPLTPKDRLSVLYAYAKPKRLAHVSWDNVKRSIEQGFAAWNPDTFVLDVIQQTTRGDLIKALNKKHYDVFHFSGHGTVDETGQGRLIFTDGVGGEDYITGKDLAGILRGRKIRLVVLAACDSAAGDFNDDFAVTAEALVKEGIPAVVANQMPIHDDTIAPFAGAMYTSLLQSGDIDQAVSEGRRVIAHGLRGQDLSSDDEAYLDWGIPTLYRHIGASKFIDKGGLEK